jgi:NADPH:quinone reductase-like Zn-dependent oxidoreductase
MGEHGMKAIVIRMGGAASVLTLETVDTPQPPPGQARVHLKAAALNHRDVFQRIAYAGPAPMILGSDGAGTVAAVGSPADGNWVGKDVVINPALHWGDREDAPGHRFQILGNPTPGTYAEHVVVPVENLAPKPAHLSFLQAAALPLAGLTAWRALFTQGRLRSGETVLLPGIGGGVAGLALAFAKRAGARAIVTSSGAQKLKDALATGADGAVNYTAGDWEQQVREAAGPAGIDLVLDHSGAQTLPAAIRLVRPGGRIVFFGATTGPQVTFSVRDVYFKQIHLIGTTMGSPREFEALFRFVAQTRYQPDLRHVFPLDQAAAAHSLMEAGGQYGKIVLQV